MAKVQQIVTFCVGLRKAAVCAGIKINCRLSCFLQLGVCFRYFPFQTVGACALGCGSAVVALILPFPRAASGEAKTRVAAAARVSTATFSSLVESYTALSVRMTTLPSQGPLFPNRLQ